MNKSIPVDYLRGLGIILLLIPNLLAHAFVFSVQVGNLVVANQSSGVPVIWGPLPIVMSLNLGDIIGAGTLINGTTSWDDNAEGALADWNTVSSTLFRVNRQLGSSCNQFDGVNIVAFRDDICGDGFGDAIAVTRQNALRDTSSRFRWINADVIFNRNVCWNAYFGPLVPCSQGGTLNDLSRVALHEFGHVLGLDHPDQGGQGVFAIMNSGISDIDFLTLDDTNGAAAIYNIGATNQSARLSNISTRAFVGTGDSVVIGGFIINGNTPKTVVVRALGRSLQNAGVPGSLSDPTLELFSGQTSIAFNDDWVSNSVAIPNTFRPSDNAESALAVTLSPGAYTAIVRGFSGSTGIALVEVFELNTSESSLLSNISTRAFVGTGDSVLIGGFIINGNTPKTVVVRALGQSLQNAGVPGTLSDPTLELFSGQTSVAFNDDWASNPGTIPSTFEPSDELESALAVTLNPGAYTAIVRGVNGSRGIALIEVFDLN